MNVAWNKFIKKEKQYKQYKIKVTAKISIKFASLGASIAMMATAPFSGGAGAVASIAGMLKTCKGIASECKKASASVEKTQKSLRLDIAKVLKSIQR